MEDPANPNAWKQRLGFRVQDSRFRLKFMVLGILGCGMLRFGFRPGTQTARNQWFGLKGFRGRDSVQAFIAHDL